MKGIIRVVIWLFISDVIVGREYSIPTTYFRYYSISQLVVLSFYHFYAQRCTRSVS